MSIFVQIASIQENPFPFLNNNFYETGPDSVLKLVDSVKSSRNHT